MLYFIANEPVNLTLSFMVDTPNGLDYAPAIDGSVKYTLRDHFGVPLFGLMDVPVPTPGEPSEVGIVIPGSYNAKTTEVARRTITYQWVSGGQLYSRRFAYYLVDWVNIDAEPAAVRAALGVNVGELPDRDISLVTAYLALKSSVGPGVDAALAAGDVTTIKINRAIVIREALRLLPSLRLKAARSESSGSESFQRFDIDWDALRDDLRAELEELLPDAEARAHPWLITAGRGDIFDA